MRNLVFKNLISHAKKRRIIASSEIADSQGMRSVIRRHFICLVKEIKEDYQLNQPLPYLYVLKEHNNKEQKKRFFCRVKGSVYFTVNGRIYIAVFAHSIKITLSSLRHKLEPLQSGNIT